MTNKKQPGSLNAKIFLLWLTATSLAPINSDGVYYALIGDNHVSISSLSLMEKIPWCNKKKCEEKHTTVLTKTYCKAKQHTKNTTESSITQH